MPQKKGLIYAISVLSLALLFAIPFFLKRDKKEITYTRNLMGTVVQLTLIEGERADFDRAAEDAFNEIKRLEGVFSSYKENSDVSRVSRNAGIGPVAVSPEAIEAVEVSLEIAEASEGAFDPTVGVLATLWGFSGESKEVPEKSAVEKLLPLVDYREIEVDRSASTVYLKKKGMVLNLGGIAKGYIVSKAASILRKDGVERAIIHAGGDMTVFQTKTSGRFTIGVQHPREKKLLGEAYADNGAISTSGDYERFFEKDGIRYHHILDPRTGFPAWRSRSVTIIAQDPTVADGLSTAVFVLGPEKGMGLADKFSAQAVIVDGSGNVVVSRGFKGRVY